MKKPIAPMNYGYRLAYTNDKAHGEFCAEHKQGVFYSDRLQQVADEIAKIFVHTNYYEDKQFGKGTDNRQYVDSLGNSAMIRTRSQTSEVRSMTLVSQTMQGLERLSSRFNLPFDSTHVRTDCGC